MENQYLTGEYWTKNATFHEEDSDFKFQNFLTLLNRNSQINISGIVDKGCGAGRIAWNFAQAFTHIRCIGIDLDPNIISYANSKYKRENLSFQLENGQPVFTNEFNLVILADVFEHIEDYIGFLQGIKNNYSYQLFNIPLDLSIWDLLTNHPLHARKAVGHLHYFYDKLALKALEDIGFTIIDYLYTDNVSFEASKQKGLKRITYFLKSKIVRLVTLILGESKTSLLLGYSSLTVLCKR